MELTLFIVKNNMFFRNILFQVLYCLSEDDVWENHGHHFLCLKMKARAIHTIAIAPVIIQKAVFELGVMKGKSTFIPKSPVINVNGKSIEDNNVRVFIISLVLLVCIESKVFDNPSMRSS